MYYNITSAMKRSKDYIKRKIRKRFWIILVQLKSAWHFDVGHGYITNVSGGKFSSDLNFGKCLLWSDQWMDRFCFNNFYYVNEWATASLSSCLSSRSLYTHLRGQPLFFFFFFLKWTWAWLLSSRSAHEAQ